MQSKVIPINLGIVKTFLIKNEKSILVDTGLKGSVDKIIRGIQNNGVNLNDISLIVITHVHTDHIGGLVKLKEKTGAKIVIHKAEADYLKTGTSVEAKPISLLGKILMRIIPEEDSVPAVEPDIIVEDSFDLKEYGVDGEIIHTPGHTQGSISIILNNGQAIVGDIIGRPGFINTEAAKYPIFACDLSALHKSLRKIIKYPIKEIYNSHGKKVTPGGIKILLNK